MGYVLGADARNAGVWVEIEIALGKPETALADVHSHDVTLSLVLINVEVEEWSDLQRPFGERDIDRVIRRANRVDPRELGVERMNTLLLQPDCVHRRRPEVTDLLRVTSSCRRRCGRLLVDLSQIHIELLAHFVSDSPGRL